MLCMLKAKPLMRHFKECVTVGASAFFMSLKEQQLKLQNDSSKSNAKDSRR